MIQIAIGLLVLAIIVIGAYSFSKFGKVDSATDVLNQAAKQARETDAQLTQTLQNIQSSQASTVQQLDSTIAALQVAQVSLADAQAKVIAVSQKVDTTDANLRGKLAETQTLMSSIRTEVQAKLTQINTLGTDVQAKLTQMNALGTDVQDKLAANQIHMNALNQRADLIDTKVMEASSAATSATSSATAASSSASAASSSATAAQNAYTAIQSLQTTLTNQINKAMDELQQLTALRDAQAASDVKIASLTSALDTLRAQVAPNYLNWTAGTAYWGDYANYRNIGTTDPRVCWEECVTDPGCTGGTFNPDKAMCWLRSGNGAYSTGIARDFAYMKPRKFLPAWVHWNPGTAYTGPDLGAGSLFTTSDPLKCHMECTLSNVCGGATFNPDKKTCLMRGAGGTVGTGVAGDYSYKKAV